MGRHKTISDIDVLAVARRVFREHGREASTREIAKVAGISEAVLYQRFTSKDALFFAAMAPSAPDIREVLGPGEPSGDALAYVRGVVERMASYFAEVLPLAIQVMTHPSFDVAAFAVAPPAAAMDRLEAELVSRLRVLEQRRSIAKVSLPEAARVLTSLAHDWALSGILSGGGGVVGRGSIAKIVDVVWSGLAPDARVGRPSGRGR